MKRSITKALCLVCAGALALGAAGCSKSDSSSSASSEAASSVLGSAADYDYQNFTYSDGLDENGYWEGIRALDYVTLPEDYASIPVQRADVEPTSEDVQAQIDSLLSQNSTTQDVTDRAAANGDTVNIDYAGTVDGVAFTGGTYTGYSLTLGSHSFIDGFEDGLIGKNVGDSFELPLTFPDTYTPNPDLAGQDVVFDVTINAIEEQVDAEWNDAFVQKNTDYETVDEYVAATKESLQQQKDSDKAYYVMEAIVNDSEFEYADSDVQALVDTQKQQYEQYASYFGMSLDDFLSNSGMTDEKLEENARFQIGCTLAIDAIGKAENMTVSDEEYQSGLEELASQYGAESGEAFEEQYGKEDVENSILYDKIMDYVVDQAVVK